MRANRQKSRAKLVFFLRNRVETVLTRTVSIDLLNLALILIQRGFSSHSAPYLLRYLCLSRGTGSGPESRAALSRLSSGLSGLSVSSVRCARCIPVVRESAALCARGRWTLKSWGQTHHCTSPEARGDRGVSQGTRYTVLFGQVSTPPRHVIVKLFHK